jgi:hypothetical protein
MWERAIPNPTDNTVMDGDFDSDCGSFAFVTGNSDNEDADFDDVDSGVTTLTSPPMNLTLNYSDPVILLYMDYYCNHGPGAIDDTLKITFSDGTNQIVELIPPQNDQMTWGFKVFYLSGLDLSNIIVSFQVSDFDENPNVTEAAIDLFQVAEYSSVNEFDGNSGISIYPNPTNGSCKVEGFISGTQYILRNAAGVEMEKGTMHGAAFDIELEKYSSGIYFIAIGDSRMKVTRL